MSTDLHFLNKTYRMQYMDQSCWWNWLFVPVFFSFLLHVFLTIMKVSFAGDSQEPLFLLLSHKEEVSYLFV